MLWSILAALLPTTLAVCGASLIFFVVWLWGLREHREIRHSPLTKDLLRPAGYSLRQQIEEQRDEIEAYLMAVVSIPLLIFSVHLSQSYFGQTPESVLRIVISLVLAAALIGFVSVRILRLLKRRKLLVLAMEAEQATGEELNQLMLEGCRVFHDIQFPYGNIDHVVVSHSGVRCVNTKMVGKLKAGDRNPEAIVDHNAGIVRFPDRNWSLPIDQTQTEARWLSQTLSSAVGWNVDVEAMVALPGWYIKDRLGKGSPYVFNPCKPKRFFVHKWVTLSNEQIEAIAHQLEQLSRNVKPSFKRKVEWAKPA